MKHKLLTTGQAAKLLSVTPDTVLKWIKGGQLPANQTAGGHYRIRPQDLNRLRGHQVLHGRRRGRTAVVRSSFEYCWEYNSKDGVQLPECKDCIVFRTRAYRCYEVLKLAPGTGHAQIFCRETCEKCDYFRRVHKQNINVLVISPNSELSEALLRDRDTVPFNLQCADSEYSCSAMVESFRPDFALIDCDLGAERSRELTRHLIMDSRVPCVRVVLAAKNGDHPRECDGAVFARIEAPFAVGDIADCIAGVNEALAEDVEER